MFCHHYHKHLIFYKKTSDGSVLIVRILHEKMDILPKLS
ncbi:MAG: type II toxin-antitoxin system RelE/ParE family toxin [Bacteroidales bacterium]|nr:type II toxin-antitoxin system RelE/ParE family toxin [Bacteroidales bacterium]